jgi:hypothetical protein
MMLRLACAASVLAIVLASASASAATRPRGVGVRLEYDIGAVARQCPKEKTLRGEVAAEIGRDPFTDAGPWRLHVTLAHGKSGAVVANADLFDSEGATFATMGEMVAPTCQMLVVKVVALWIALQLTDPPAPPPMPAPLPPPAALPSTPPSLPAPPELPPPEASRPAIRLRLGAATGIEIGVGPTPTPVFSLSLSLHPTTAPILSLAIEARADLPLPATGDDGSRVHALVVTGSLLACFHAFEGGILYGCPMFTAGLISSGERYATSDARGVYVASGARLGAAIPLSSHRFAVTLAGDVLGTLHPFRLLVETHPVWQTGPLSGAVQLGFSAFL